MTTHLAATGTADANDHEGQRLPLADHHRELEAMYRALLAATYADDARDLVFAYRAFEQEILEHLAAEEQEILPAYERAAPHEARAIRGDHDRIRQELQRVGVYVELHVIRAETMHGVIAELRAHSAREGTRMYPWAQLHLPTGAKQRIEARVTASLQRLEAAAKRIGTAI